MIVVPLIIGIAAFCTGIVGEGADSWLAVAAGCWIVGDTLERISIARHERVRS